MVGVIFCGIAGTGGASAAAFRIEDLAGEGSRKLRSLIDPTLFFLSMLGRESPDILLPMEPTDETEPLRRAVLLV